MDNYLLSIDPSGDPRGHTGIVLLSYDQDTPATLVDSWAIPGGVPAFTAWYNVNTKYGLAGHPRTVWVVEHFVDRQIAGADRSAMLVEGAIRFVRPDVVLSPASGYKTAVPDSVLRRLGLWFTGDHHADRNSAARHAIRYLKNQKHIPTLKAGWGK